MSNYDFNQAQLRALENMSIARTNSRITSQSNPAMAARSVTSQPQFLSQPANFNTVINNIPQMQLQPQQPQQPRLQIQQGGHHDQYSPDEFETDKAAVKVLRRVEHANEGAKDIVKYLQIKATEIEHKETQLDDAYTLMLNERRTYTDTSRMRDIGEVFREGVQELNISLNPFKQIGMALRGEFKDVQFARGKGREASYLSQIKAATYTADAETISFTRPVTQLIKANMSYEERHLTILSSMHTISRYQGQELVTIRNSLRSKEDRTGARGASGNAFHSEYKQTLGGEIKDSFESIAGLNAIFEMVKGVGAIAKGAFSVISPILTPYYTYQKIKGGVGKALNAIPRGLGLSYDKSRSETLKDAGLDVNLEKSAINFTATQLPTLEEDIRSLSSRQLDVQKDIYKVLGETYSFLTGSETQSLGSSSESVARKYDILSGEYVTSEQASKIKADRLQQLKDSVKTNRGFLGSFRSKNTAMHAENALNSIGGEYKQEFIAKLEKRKEAREESRLQTIRHGEMLVNGLLLAAGPAIAGLGGVANMFAGGGFTQGAGFGASIAQNMAMHAVNNPLIAAAIEAGKFGLAKLSAGSIYGTVGEEGQLQDLDSVGEEYQKSKTSSGVKLNAQSGTSWVDVINNELPVQTKLLIQILDAVTMAEGGGSNRSRIFTSGVANDDLEVDELEATGTYGHSNMYSGHDPSSPKKTISERLKLAKSRRIDNQTLTAEKTQVTLLQTLVDKFDDISFSSGTGKDKKISIMSLVGGLAKTVGSTIWTGLKVIGTAGGLWLLKKFGVFGPGAKAGAAAKVGAEGAAAGAAAKGGFFSKIKARAVGAFETVSKSKFGLATARVGESIASSKVGVAIAKVIAPLARFIMPLSKIAGPLLATGAKIAAFANPIGMVVGTLMTAYDTYKAIDIYYQGKDQANSNVTSTSKNVTTSKGLLIKSKATLARLKKSKASRSKILDAQAQVDRHQYLFNSAVQSNKEAKRIADSGVFGSTIDNVSITDEPMDSVDSDARWVNLFNLNKRKAEMDLRRNNPNHSVRKAQRSIVNIFKTYEPMLRKVREELESARHAIVGSNLIHMISGRTINDIIKDRDNLKKVFTIKHSKAIRVLANAKNNVEDVWVNIIKTKQYIDKLETKLNKQQSIANSKGISSTIGAISQTAANKTAIKLHQAKEYLSGLQNIKTPSVVSNIPFKLKHGARRYTPSYLPLPVTSTSSSLSTPVRSVTQKIPGYIQQFISEASSKYGIDPMLLAKVIQTESNFNPNAQSDKGAQGLLQLVPGTAKDLGVTDPFDPRQSVYGGARYLAQLSKRYKGDMVKTLAAYNWGLGNLDRLGLREAPGDTVAYVKNIIGVDISKGSGYYSRLSGDVSASLDTVRGAYNKVVPIVADAGTYAMNKASKFTSSALDVVGGDHKGATLEIPGLAELQSAVTQNAHAAVESAKTFANAATTSASAMVAAARQPGSGVVQDTNVDGTTRAIITDLFSVFPKSFQHRAEQFVGIQNLHN